MTNFAEDVGIVLAICAIGMVFAWLAYWRGEPVWKRNFVIKGSNLPKWVPISSGEVGELANIGLIGAVLIVLLVLTPDSNLTDLLAEYWPYYIGLLLASIVGILVYTRAAVGKVEKGAFAQRIKKTPQALKQLDVGYRYYVGYCAMIALLIWGIAGITVQQTLMDRASFEALEAQIFQTLSGLGAVTGDDKEQVQLVFEVVFGQQKIAKGYVLDQVNSLLMLLLCIALAYFTVYKTNLKHVYAEGALTTLKVILFVMIGGCLVLGCYVFFSVHLVFVDRLLASFTEYAPLMNSGPWPLTQRYQELIAQLFQERGIFGFLIALTTDRGGLVLIAPAIQLLMMKNAESDKNEAAKA